MSARTILAMGGDGFQMEPDNRLLDDHVLRLARERSGRNWPRILLIPTATGDDAGLIADFERLFAPPRTEPRVLHLFTRADDELVAVVGEQDAVHVHGDNTANLLALWRLYHGEAQRRPLYRRGAWRVEPRVASRSFETALPTRYLGAS